MPQPVQLCAVVGKGQRKTPNIVNPDGTESQFLIPSSGMFIATDISIHRTGVVAGSDLFDVTIRQNPPSISQIRWAFVGEMSQKFERSFTSGLRFSTPFEIENGSPSADVVAVRLWGYFDTV